MATTPPKLLSFEFKSTMHLAGCGIAAGADQQKKYTLSDKHLFRRPELVPEVRADYDLRLLLITTTGKDGRHAAQTFAVPFENLKQMTFEAPAKKAPKPKPTDKGKTTKATSTPAEGTPAK